MYDGKSKENLLGKLCALLYMCVGVCIYSNIRIDVCLCLCVCVVRCEKLRKKYMK